jgi:coenzyme F420-reducing hydrogenase beta subunit
MQKNFKYYLGNSINTRIGYSNNEKIRKDCASGGIVTSILIYLLESKQIDGAFVTKTQITNNGLEAIKYIAKTREEILESRTSIYFDTQFFKHIETIKNFKGKLAIVGLPCEIKYLRERQKWDENFKNIQVTIGLFCGHASKKELIETVLKQKNIKTADIKKITFRKGHWRGQTHIELNNGKEITFPFSHFSLYQNLFFLSENKCLYCNDHTSEMADISCGDIWDLKFKKTPIKHSAIITRTENGEKFIENMLKLNIISSFNVSEKKIYKAQKRSLLYHKHIKARSIVGKLFGFKIPYSKKEISRPWDYIAAFIVLINHRISESKFGKKFIFKIPKPILKIYLYIFKGLTSF